MGDGGWIDPGGGGGWPGGGAREVVDGDDGESWVRGVWFGLGV